jgi:membrane protease YdiL (CAAX protease family)
MPTEPGSGTRDRVWVASAADDDGLRRFRRAVLAGWVMLAAAGLLYARMKGIPRSTALPVLAAFLSVYPFYLVPGIEALRAWIEERFTPLELAGWLTASALLPYLIFSLPIGQFRWGALAQVACLALAVSLWYVVLPASRGTDLGLVAFVAAVLLRGYFAPIYSSPSPALKGLEILGHVTLVYLTATVLLTVRRITGVGFGFLPTRDEWMIGLRHFVYFLPVGLPLALALKQIHWSAHNLIWWRLAGTFLGALWVVALSEEFFFRGLLQQWLGLWSGNRQLARLLASVLFGLAHLPFRAFPNWRFALLAAVAGWFYGRAYDRAGSIRASMVTHALVVTLRAALL